MKKSYWKLYLSLLVMTSLLAIIVGCGTPESVSMANESTNDGATNQTEEVEEEEKSSNEPLSFEFADNFRDLAGPGAGYETESGKKVKQGIVYRSNYLKLSSDEVEEVADLEISNVYDLRTPAEIEENPNVDIPGANMNNCNVLGWDNVDYVRESFTVSVADTLDGAEDLYRLLATDPNVRKEVGIVLTEIAENDGAHVINCSGGKDRTGWMAALLLTIAGVPHDVIVEDFLLSNENSLETIIRDFENIARSKGVEAALAHAPFQGVQAEWLEIAYEEAEKKYGSMDNYFLEGLGLTEETIKALEDKLTE